MAKKSKASKAGASKRGARTAKGGSKTASKAARGVRSAAGASRGRSAAKKASRKTTATAAKKGTPKAAKRGTAKAAKKSTAKGAKKNAATGRKTGGGARKPAPTSAGRGATSPAAARARKVAQEKTAAAVGRRPNLDRERRTVREEDLVPTPPSSLNMDRSASSARTGREEYAERLREHTSTGPAMTGGDVDADWQDAETVGDQAPGGDNPTPDQDVVDEIGRAIGIEYDDDEELQGGDELVERDRHRWELDPASREDVDEE